MPCNLLIDTEVKQDILDCDKSTRRDIYEFLLRLQHRPLPLTRVEIDTNAYSLKLDCGFFISWEIVAPQSGPISLTPLEHLTVRILGVARAEPRHRKNSGAR